MFFTLILENESGDQLNLTTTANKYMISEIDNSRTVNQTNNSPKSLSRLKIYRQTRNALNV